MAESAAAPEKAQDPAPEMPVLLLCGAGELAAHVGPLAAACGFEVNVAQVPPRAGARLAPELSLAPPDAGLDQAFPEAVRRFVVDDLSRLLEICDVGLGHFICIDLEDLDQALAALAMALQSRAAYIGLSASRDEWAEIFAILRGRGVPEAELFAVSCPMGLPVGALTPQQKAVAVVAELLAARAGVLKRLRPDA